MSGNLDLAEIENKQFINKVKKELIETTYYRDLKYNIRSKSRWKFVGDFTETLAHILIGIATILAFSAGFFKNEYLSFASGCVSTASLVFIQFSSYSVRESKERTAQVNTILTKLGIDSIPDITIDSTVQSEQIEV